MPKNYQQGQESIIQGVYLSPEKSGDNIEALRMAMYGWDYTNNVWRRISVDENGTLQTNGASTPSSVYGTGVYGTATYS